MTRETLTVTKEVEEDRDLFLCNSCDHEIDPERQSIVVYEAVDGTDEPMDESAEPVHLHGKCAARLDWTGITRPPTLADLDYGSGSNEILTAHSFGSTALLFLSGVFVGPLLYIMSYIFLTDFSAIPIRHVGLISVVVTCFIIMGLLLYSGRITRDKLLEDIH